MQCGIMDISLETTCRLYDPSYYSTLHISISYFWRYHKSNRREMKIKFQFGRYIQPIIERKPIIFLLLIIVICNSFQAQIIGFLIFAQ